MKKTGIFLTAVLAVILTLIPAAVFAAGGEVNLPEPDVNTFIYDGTEHVFIEERQNAGYTVTGGSATDAGNYTALVTLKNGYRWAEGGTGEKRFNWTINKAVPVASNFIFTLPEDLVSDGTPKRAEIYFDNNNGLLTGIGDISVMYSAYNGYGWSFYTSDVPVDPGTYRACVNVSEGINYTSAQSITCDEWVFTITAPMHIHETVNFETKITSWTELESLFANGGSGYLAADVTNPGTNNLYFNPNRKVSLCLNGHTIDLNEKAIFVDEGAEFNLYDCNTYCVHEGYIDDSGLWHAGTAPEGADAVNITGGMITGGWYVNGGCVYVNDASFVMNGGTICGGAARNGGGIYVTGGNFTMNGGTVSGNAAYGTDSGFGGGVFVDEGTFTMNGGCIENNTATDSGGGVYCEYGLDEDPIATVILTGGCIKNNKAADGGGGIYNFGRLYFGGTAVVKDNTSDGAANDVECYDYDNTPKIYVYSVIRPEAGMCIGLAGGSAEVLNAISGDEKYFFSDDDELEAKFDSTRSAVVLERKGGSAKYTATLNLADSIGILMYVNDPVGDPELFNIKVTYKGVTVNTALSDTRKVADGKYEMLIADCAAMEMFENVHVAVTYNGTDVKEFDYSVYNYCNNKINSEKSPEELKTLCGSVLDYGVYAKTFFKYSETYPVEYDYTASDVSGVTVSGASASRSPYCTGISAVSATLSLESKTSIIFYLTPEEGYDKDSFDFSYSTENGPGLIPDVSTDSTGRIQVTLSGIAASDLGTTYTLDVESNGEWMSVSYSPMTYAAAKQTSATPGLPDLVRSLYLYFSAAQNFFR